MGTPEDTASNTAADTDTDTAKTPKARKVATPPISPSLDVSAAELFKRLDTLTELLGRGVQLLGLVGSVFERLIEAAPPLNLVAPSNQAPAPAPAPVFPVAAPSAPKAVGKRVAVPAAAIGTASQGNRNPPPIREKNKVPGFARRQASPGIGGAPAPAPAPTPAPTASAREKLAHAFALGQEAAAELGPIEGAIVKAKLDAFSAELSKSQGR